MQLVIDNLSKQKAPGPDMPRGRIYTYREISPIFPSSQNQKATGHILTYAETGIVLLPKHGRSERKRTCGVFCAQTPESSSEY